jgi:hypothetical protein
VLIWQLLELLGVLPAKLFPVTLTYVCAANDYLKAPGLFVKMRIMHEHDRRSG